MLAFQPPLNHWDSQQAVSKDNAAPQYDSAVSHKCAPSARVSSSSRWCVCVCVCVKARDVGLYRMHWCIHEHVLSSVHLRATIATWLKYCFSMHIPNAHIYVTFQPLISPLHALLTDVAFVGFRWVHCEVTLYRMRSCLTPDDIQMRESKSCGVSGQPWLSWFTFCFELFRL